MRRIKVASGECFGELTVLREAGLRRKRRFLCRCACGREVVVRLAHLRSGHTNSCGRCGVQWRGQRKTIAQLAREEEIPESTLRSRLKIMDLPEALERGKPR